MIKKSFADLTSFLLFFLIILVLFTFVMGTLGFSHYTVPLIVDDGAYNAKDLIAN
jgi:hypothetical protein